MKQIINCPKCNSSFDISEYTEVIRTQILEEVDKIINKMKGDKDGSKKA